jgi:hypothetical protein
MLYLRADQVELVTAQADSVDPIRDAEHLRFRFPFPSEDGIEPGAFDDPDRTMRVDGLDLSRIPFEHGTVQFTARPGYVVSLPCPESNKGKETAQQAGYRVFKNGWKGDWHIVQQRVLEGRLVLVMECGGCGSRFRLPTLADAAPVVEALIRKVEEERNPYNRFGSETAATMFLTVAQRVTAGYNDPPAWVAATAPAPEPAPIVESINEGQLAGQLRIGGDDVRAQITEDFFLTQTAPQPKAPAPAPAPQPALIDA